MNVAIPMARGEKCSCFHNVPGFCFNKTYYVDELLKVKPEDDRRVQIERIQAFYTARSL